MSHFDYKQFYGRNLPHIQPPGATLFVTFRLAGSIPKSIMNDWLREKRVLEARTTTPARLQLGSIAADVIREEKLSFQRRWFAKFESTLHAETSGPLWLKDNTVAAIVEEALKHRDSIAYRLDAFCIMANHVHAVFAPLLTESRARELAANQRSKKLAGRRTTQTNSLRYSEPTNDDSVLSVIMQSLKGYTARKCNLALNREGEFWQHESFDHVVQDRAELRRVVNYVLNNPVKAGLVKHWTEWQWNYLRPSLMESGLISGDK